MRHCSPVGPELWARAIYVLLALSFGLKPNFYLILRLLSTEAYLSVALDVSKLHVLEVKRLSTACKLVASLFPYFLFLLLVII